MTPNPNVSQKPILGSQWGNIKNIGKHQTTQSIHYLVDHRPWTETVQQCQ